MKKKKNAIEISIHIEKTGSANIVVLFSATFTALSPSLCFSHKDGQTNVLYASAQSSTYY